jgi:Zn-dependent M28 family amino/carboxypeptidase
MLEWEKRARAMRWMVLGLCSVALLAGDLAQDGRRWWSHVQFLADDRMEGRNTGSEAYRRAARYVAEQFERAGLKPAGTDGYWQPVRFLTRQIVEAESSVALVRDTKVQPLTLGEDVTIGLRGGVAPYVEAPAVFTGYGLRIPEKHYDDLAGLDLKGKVAVYLGGGPADIPGPLKAHAQSAGERWKALRQAGAIGVVSIPDPKAMDIPWERAKLARLQVSMVLADPKLNETADEQLSLVMNPAQAEKLFAGSGHTFAEILALHEVHKPLPHFPLPVTIQAKVTVKEGKAESPNVVGVRPGNDPKLRNEYVVFSAHLDHVGVGEPIQGDRIYNGAMDDASGVASLIETARSLAQDKTPLRRSVLFLAVCGEEKGLLGSRYFAAHPTVERRNIVADLNIDMFLPLYPLRILFVQGLEESDLAKPLRAAAERLGIEIRGDPEPQRNRFIRSDQYSFIREGIPALAFKFGYDKGSPEEKIQRAWTRVRYHAPSDDLQQPVDLEAAAKFDALIRDLIVRIANQEERPRWNETSFFRRFAR